MTLELKSESKQESQTPAEEPKKPTVSARALTVARKYTELSYTAALNRIREETPCSKTTAHVAFARAKIEKGKGKGETGAAKTPSVTIVDEKEKKPEFLEEKEAVQETLQEIEQPAAAAHLLQEGELTSEDMASLFEAANEGVRMFSLKYAPSDKSAKMLGKLWVRPFNKFWATISEQNPLLAIAIVTTIIVYLPALIGAVIEWRKNRPIKSKEIKTE